MRVLSLHSRYLSGATSGENHVVDDEARLLRDAGHDVHVWSPSVDARGAVGLIRAGMDAIWSRRAVTELRELIRMHEPDVVHCHNLFPTLSPAVLRIASERGCAVVMTLHNYRMMCLPATLLRNDRLCEACVGRIPWRGIVHRCYRGSVAGSASMAGSLVLHRGISTFERVDLYLAISRFVKEKHVQAGLPASRISVKPNFAWESPRRRAAGEYFLFLGRLTPEKGVATLLRSWRAEFGNLMIVGEGPQEAELKAMAPDSVRFVPSVQPSEVPALLGRARALMVPSVWYEGAGKVVLEAYAAGVPVLASRIGALPELVVDDVTGVLIAPEDIDGWSEATRSLLDDERAERLGAAAWRAWDARFRPSHALRGLEEAYERASSEASAR